MRIKQVSQKTGLTEKTIRFYIKEQLITPEVSLGITTIAISFPQRMSSG